jgi:hypothetical protein
MDVSLLTPKAAAVGLVVLLALAALAVGERRSRRACSLLGLRPRRFRSTLADATALAAIAGLVSLAATQPVVSGVDESRGRADAEVIVVMDITRSMLAQSGRSNSNPNRLERSKVLAKELRAALPEFRVGVASLTDRVLPHLFPSVSGNAFTSTLDRAIGIERPPPDRRSRTRATALGALPDVGRLNFFSRSTRRRVVVVFTDGESIAIGLGTFRARFLSTHTALVLVHVWRSDERVYAPDGTPERYRPDPGSRVALERVAAAVNGVVVAEDGPPEAHAAVRRLLGEGPMSAQGRELTAIELAPVAAAAAFAPLVFLLRRRNL